MPEWQGDWTLDIDGEVEHPLSLSLKALKAYEQSDIEATLECDFSFGPSLLVGNAVWSGLRLRSLIELAVPKSTASSVTFYALDGYERGPFPLEEVLQKTDALVALAMNGEPLPKIQGWPAKIVLPGHTGHQWVRWLDRIEISSDPVGGDSFRQWPIHARITEPGYNAVVGNAPYTIRGMVNAGEGKEIAAVQVSTDNGETWASAEMLTDFVPDVWRHWQYTWTPETSGKHTIFARAIDKDGNVQNENRPYGWRGYKVLVTVDSEIECVNPQLADLNNDLHIDFSDYALFAGRWLVNGPPLSVDDMPDGGDRQTRIQDLVFVADHWLDCLVPAAVSPLPSDGQEDVGLTPLLTWLAQDGLLRYDVYIGTDACSVTAATRDSREFLGSVMDNRFAMTRVLESDTVYYWRVDQVGRQCTAPGEVWGFNPNYS